MWMSFDWTDDMIANNINKHQKTNKKKEKQTTSITIYLLFRGRPLHCISFLSLDMISIAMRTLRASYTLRRMFFSSYCCWTHHININSITVNTLYHRHECISLGEKWQTWSGDEIPLPGSENSATSSSATCIRVKFL